MKKTLVRHKWLTAACSVVLIAGVWLAAMLVKPPASKAAAPPEFPAFVFPPVSLGGGGVNAELCAANMGDGSVRDALIGLLDVGDTTKALFETKKVSFEAHTGKCMSLIPPAARGHSSTDSVIPFVAFQNSQTWDISGKAFNASIQVERGNSRQVLTPMFLPALQIPE